MPKKARDFRIVPGDPDVTSPAPGLRVLKTVEGGDGSSYVVPVPGMAPAGLKLSIHPSGEIHLKDREYGLVARLDLLRVVRGIYDGKLDNLLSKLIRAPEAGTRVEGFVVPTSLMERLSGVGDSSKPDLALPASEVLSSLILFEVEDSARLAEAISVLRGQGHLVTRGIVMLKTEGSDHETVFLNVGDPKNFGPLPELGEDVPMRRSLERLFAQLREFGGFFVDWPNDEEFETLLREAGFGEFYDGLKKYAESPGMVGLEKTMLSREGEIAAMFSGTIAGFLDRPVLRPLEPKEAGSK